MVDPQLVLITVLAYVLGSIPFGLVLTRLAGLGDIRDVGSGNIGATNVLRTGNKGLALATLLLDGGKGAIAVFLAFQIEPNYGPAFAAMASFAGHVFPLWLKFKGGKGVATYFGTLLMLSWPVGIATLLTWAATSLLFRMSSLSALLASASVAIWAYIMPTYNFAMINKQSLIYVSLFLTAMIFWSHRENIRRILKGEEPKIGQK
jgi:glycerol-3-phosphate acyltransferase PlsY